MACPLFAFRAREPDVTGVRRMRAICNLCHYRNEVIRCSAIISIVVPGTGLQYPMQVS